MSTSTTRPLALRRRSDLVAARHSGSQGSYWVVKDPLALEYFRLAEEEYALLELLDGPRSLDDLQAAFQDRFAPRKIRHEELSRWLSMLHRSGLLVADAAGQGDQLYQRRRQKQRRLWQSRVSNVLAVRLRGIDPGRLLDGLDRWVGWLLSPPAVAAGLALMLAAVALVAVEFDTFRARLPSFQEFFTPAGAVWLLLVLAATKVLHELGHGLACRRHGAGCHELGLMLLVFTPCLYCNTSDSWLLASKWQRAGIAAAGMYVDLLVAALATLVWWSSQPGLLNSLALSTMFVCSASTLVFNANPLLRYDGYYILSDLLELPNLAGRATALLRGTLAGWLLGGGEGDHQPELPRRHRLLFVLYALAAPLYRWLVVLSILWFLHALLKPYRLTLVTCLLACATLGQLLVVPLWQLARFLSIPGRMSQMNYRRLWPCLAALAALAAAAVWLPLPARVYGVLQLQARDARQVFVDVPGRLVELAVGPGQQVQPGAVLARLENVDLELAVEHLAGRARQYRQQLAALKRQRFASPAAAAQMAAVAESLAGAEEQLAGKQRDLARLELVSPAAGTLLPPPEQSAEAARAAGQLPDWSGTPLAERNLGCLLQEATLVCQVGDPRRWDALVVVPQDDVELLAVGQPVRVVLDALPHRTFAGRVAEVARSRLAASPRHLSNKAGGELASRTDAAGIDRPLEASYQVRVPLDDPEGLLRLGLKGQARIQVAPAPLAARLVRLLRNTFHFRL